MTSPTSMQGQDRSLSIPNIHQGQILLEFATAQCISSAFCWSSDITVAGSENPVPVDMVNMQLVLRSSET